MNIFIDDSGGGPPPVTYTTLNPSDKSASITLSGGDLVATGTSGTSGIVRAAHGKSTGKWYFEGVLTTGSTSDTVAVGLANSSHTLSASLGYANSNGWGAWGQSGSGFRNGSLINSAGFSNGSVIGFHVDLDNDRLWVSHNGIFLQGNPATASSPSSTNLSGTIYPAAGPWTNGSVVTMRFDPASWSYTPASGYGGWTA